MNASLASFAPFNISLISSPAHARGKSPTGVRTEYLPPISPGRVKVTYPSLLHSLLRAPFSLSVVAKIAFLAASLPIWEINNSFNSLKEIEVSVVVHFY